MASNASAERLIRGLIRSRSLSADALDDRDHLLMELRLVPLLKESERSRRSRSRTALESRPAAALAPAPGRGRRVAGDAERDRDRDRDRDEFRAWRPCTWRRCSSCSRPRGPEDPPPRLLMALGPRRAAAAGRADPRSRLTWPPPPRAPLLLSSWSPAPPAALSTNSSMRTRSSMSLIIWSRTAASIGGCDRSRDSCCSSSAKSRRAKAEVRLARRGAPRDESMRRVVEMMSLQRKRKEEKNQKIESESSSRQQSFPQHMLAV